jgi:flagellar basal-body rod protein FlgB
MLLERLFNSGPTGVLEAQMRFTEARHKLLVENNANANTPGYRTKELDVEGFNAMLRDRLDQRDAGGALTLDDLGSRLIAPSSYVIYHDGNNRSPEANLAEAEKNALRHNLYAELLRKSYSQIDMALKERVA